MTAFDWPGFIANLCGLAGVVLLAVPALHVSRYALKAASLARLRPDVRKDPRLRRQLETTIGELNTTRDSGHRGKALLLIGGMVAGAASYVIPVVVDLADLVTLRS